jgi:hypothetical protein
MERRKSGYALYQDRGRDTAEREREDAVGAIGDQAYMLTCTYTEGSAIVSAGTLRDASS